MVAIRDKCFDVIRRDVRLGVTRWPPSPLRKLVRAVGCGAFCCFHRESPVAAEPTRANTSSADWLCQALLGGCAAAGGAAGEGFGTAGGVAEGDAAGAAVDAFGPAVSGIEAGADPAFGAGAPVSLCPDLGSLTGLGWDSPADL